MRFHDRLTVRMNVDPETLDALVPNLILQPIVENAIRHGIIACAGEGRIEVQSGRRNGCLQLQVRDNGPGLQASLDSGNRRGLGFSLTQQRLERLYAGEQRLTLEDADGGGLKVTVEFPFVKLEVS